jgi:hypothetical protein
MTAVNNNNNNAPPVEAIQDLVLDFETLLEGHPGSGRALLTAYVEDLAELRAGLARIGTWLDTQSLRDRFPHGVTLVRRDSHASTQES